MHIIKKLKILNICFKQKYQKAYYKKWIKERPDYHQYYYQNVKSGKKIYNRKRFAEIMRIFNAYKKGKLVWK